MPFTVISTGEIDVGDPLKKELFDKIKDNFDDHESRINSVETSARKVDVFKYMVVNASSADSMTGLDYFRADESFTLTSCTIQIFEKGTLGGALEINIKKSTTDMNDVSFTTVFVSAPRLTMGSVSDYAISTNQVFDNSKVSIVAGNYLRFDVTEMPTNGTLGKFIICLYGVK